MIEVRFLPSTFKIDLLFSTIYLLYSGVSDQFLTDFQHKQNKVLEVLKRDLSTIRVGRANPRIVEDVVLSVYDGTATLKLEELGTITTEDAQTLVFVPFDVSIIDEIEKGLRAANLNLSIIPDEDKIRMRVPELTAERREEFIALVGKKVEGARIMARQVRKEAMQEIDRWMRSEEISEDEKFRLEKKAQEVVDEVMEEIEKIGERKEEEIRSI